MLRSGSGFSQDLNPNSFVYMYMWLMKTNKIQHSGELLTDRKTCPSSGQILEEQNADAHSQHCTYYQ